MSCNLGKTRTRFTVNSIVFVILFWFLVEHFKLSARTKDARDTRDAFLESVYPCVRDVTCTICPCLQLQSASADNVSGTHMAFMSRGKKPMTS